MKVALCRSQDNEMAIISEQLHVLSAEDVSTVARKAHSYTPTNALASHECGVVIDTPPGYLAAHEANTARAGLPSVSYLEGSFGPIAVCNKRQ